MHFAVSVLDQAVRSRGGALPDLVDEHGDRSCFLFLDVKKLDQPLLQQILKVQLSLTELVDVCALEEGFAILANQQGSLHSAGIGEDPDLFADVVFDD